MPKKTEISQNWISGRFTVFVLVLVAFSIIPASLIKFPVGDSWTHGWTVQQWIDSKFILSDWSSAFALPQQILGWILHIGSDSVNWSRLSIITAIVTILGCAIASKLPSALYPELKEIKAWEPLFLVSMLAPTFTLKVAAGFMTDGYYLFFMSAALWLLLSAINEPEKQSGVLWTKRWAGFMALATLAALQRTHGLTILFIVAVWIILAKLLYPVKGENEGFDRWRGMLPVILSIAGLVFAMLVMKNPDFAPARSSEVTTELINFWTGHIMSLSALIQDRIYLLFGIFEHFGATVLPVSLLVYSYSKAKEKIKLKAGINWWYVFCGTIFLLIAVVLFSKTAPAQYKYLFPYLGNSLTDEGFGPKSDTLVLTSGHELATWLRLTLTGYGTLGGLTLIYILSRTVRIRNIDWRSPTTLIGAIGIAHLGLVIINVHFFDRYLLPLIPFAFCWFVPVLKDFPQKNRILGWILVVPLLAISLWGTYDSLKWANSKWELAMKAHEMGIAHDHIIAGYEPDGYFNFSNENYPGLDFQRTVHAEAWWVDRLGLKITPYYVIFEEGADPSNTMWYMFKPTDISNGIMRVWMVQRKE